MANAPRKNVSKSIRYKILRETNFMCIYCGGDANQVDHIIPYSYSQNNDESNLVPTCDVCNGIASNKIFDSLAHKMLFIQRRRKAKKLFPIISGVEIPSCDAHDEFPEQKLFDKIEKVKEYFIELFKKYSYNDIAQAYDINKGVVWKIIKKDYEPKKNEIRRNLGLPHYTTVYQSRPTSPKIPQNIIDFFNQTIEKRGGINKGCKHIAKQLRYKWTWKHLYNVYSGRIAPGKKLYTKLNTLRLKPARKRYRKIIEATSKEQLEKWNTLSADELRDALDNQVDRISP